MCGRFALSAPAEHIRSHFNLKESGILAPRYNIAPTQQVAVITQNGLRSISMMHWGLLPPGAGNKKTGAGMINARAETLLEKRTFKGLVRKQRCLIPADGFYEWKSVPGQKKKQPYFICLHRRMIFAFAGLWTSWEDPDSGERAKTCTIVTTMPNELVSRIHNRMPAILKPEQYSAWLDCNVAVPVISSFLGPYDSAEMQCYPVSTICNSPVNDLPACIRRI